MTRSASAAAIVLSLAFFCPDALAQSNKAAAAPNKPAAPPPTAPTAKAAWVSPVKGTAYIQVIKGEQKRVKDDIVTTLKVKNISTGAIALLKVDDYWYDKKNQNVTGTTEKIRQPIMPGEVVEITLKSPWKPNLQSEQFFFSHANGKVDAKSVKKFN